MIRRATVHDVAQRAGTSPSTVSNALRPVGSGPPVAAATRERVLRAIRDLGYQPNQVARNLRGRKESAAITLLIGGKFEGTYLELLQGIHDGIGGEVASQRYRLQIARAEDDLDDDALYVAAEQAGETAGLVLILAERLDVQPLLALHARGLPIVHVNHRSILSPVPSITVDNRHGMFAATSHLLDLGHRRIAFLMGTETFGCSRERLHGYLHALAARRVAADSTLVHRDGCGFRSALAYEHARELLQREAPPTAIVASNDLAAMGVLLAAKDLGRQVPGDLSVVGFDDVPLASDVRPMLTTVRQPFYEMGQTATRLLTARLEGGTGTPDDVELPVELVVRDSTGPAPSR